MCQGSVGCATSILEFLSCWLFKRDAPHCGFVCSWGNKVMNGVASEEGICPHTHSLPPFSPSSISPPINPHTKCVHTLGLNTVVTVRAEMCELWRSAEPLSRAVAIKQKHSQHERIPAIYKRKWKIWETMSEFCFLGWSDKPGVAAAPSNHPFTLKPNRCPSHHHHVHPSHPPKLYFLTPVRRRISVTSQKNMSTLTAGFHSAILRGHQGLHFEPGSSREHSNPERFIWLSLQMSWSEIYF